MNQHDDDIKNLPKVPRIVVIVLGWLGGAGAAAFLLAVPCVLLGRGHPHLGSTLCFPLSDPTSVVVRENGEVLVALSYYGRIQVYDKSGDFKFGYFANSAGGHLRLRFDDAGNLVVVPSRQERVYVYDRNGRLQDSILKTDFHPVEPDQIPSIDRDGRRYHIVSGLWNPRIIREELNGDRSTLLQTPVLLRPFVGPLPCWALALGAVVAQRVLIRRFRRKDSTAPKAPQRPDNDSAGCLCTAAATTPT